MTVDMAAYIDGHRKSCNMGCKCLNINCKCCHPSSQSSRSNAQLINRGQQFLFQFLYPRYLWLLFYIPGKGMFRHLGAFFKGPANTHANHHRRAGIGARVPDSGNDGVLYPFQSIGGF